MTHEPKTSKRQHRSVSPRSRSTRSRLETMSRYEQIIAPFTGVVTKRYADTGSLIQAGQNNNTQTLPVVQVAESDLLRLRMPVPEGDVPYIQVGGDVRVTVSATGHTFTGKIIRFSRALDTNTRTMLTEVDVPNLDLSLDPGMYAETTIQLQQKNDALILPAQAVVQSGDQSYVLVVDATNHVEKRNVTLGIQTSNRVEITSGLQTGDNVIASGQAGYQPGEVVSPCGVHSDGGAGGERVMSSFAIKHPFFILMLCLMVIVVGVTTVARMPVDLFPEINIPVVVVATFYAGMPPQQIEADITDSYERFFTLGSGINH